MLGLGLISLVVGLPNQPAPLMSLPLDEILCLDREQPPPPPIRGRVCVEIDGVAGMECWPDRPASVPELSPGWSVRSFIAVEIGVVTPPSFSKFFSLEDRARASAGHERAIDEPPRMV